MKDDIKIDIMDDGSEILTLKYMNDSKEMGEKCDGYGDGVYYIIWESKDNKKHLKIDVKFLLQILKDKGITIECD